MSEFKNPCTAIFCNQTQIIEDWPIASDLIQDPTDTSIQTVTVASTPACERQHCPLHGRKTNLIQRAVEMGQGWWQQRKKTGS